MEQLKIQAITNGDRLRKFIQNANITAQEKRDKAFLSAREALADRYWDRFSAAIDTIYETATADDFKSDDFFKKDLYSDIECCFVEIKQWIKQSITALEPESPMNESQHSANSSFTTCTTSLQLPHLKLVTFDGNITDWPTFRDSHVSAIHENSNLSNIEKMHYLKSTVSGIAATLINRYSLTTANYTTAWQALCDRYDNKCALVSSYLEQIVRIPPMSSESHSELRRVLDTFNQAIHSLTNLSRPVDTWDDWLVYFLSKKLDTTTRKDYETSLSASTEPPTLKPLQEFLVTRLHALSTISEITSKALPAIHTRDKRPREQRFHRTNTQAYFSSQSKVCACCNGNHFILFCPTFRNKSVDQRISFLKEKKLCLNCLKGDHMILNCTSNNRCKNCQRKHHTMIHQATTSQTHPTVTPSTAALCTSSPPVNTTTCLSNRRYMSSSCILLATAIVKVRSPKGRIILARALIDQGSESCFITASLANQLALHKQNINLPIVGVGKCHSGTAKFFVQHDIVSRLSDNIYYSVTSLVLPTLTDALPSRTIAIQKWPHLENLPLADPEFHNPASVDLILGAELYAQILLKGVKRGNTTSPIAQNTTLGWILSGNVGVPLLPTSVKCHVSLVDLNNFIRKFWETEEPKLTSRLKPDEADCEQQFKDTVSRTSSGRYIVSLPLKADPKLLGDSRSAALRSLLRMEKILSHDPELSIAYNQFMQEYVDLGHMELVDERTLANRPCYYIPHHAIKKPSSSTTKVRCVFNASFKTTSGISLNDILHVGQKLQNNIASVIMKWRLFPFVFVAAVEKMFRQIHVHRSDTDLQLILWRFSPNSPVHCYRLLTVTYGTGCAPFLAGRTLLQLSEDYKTEFPQAANIIKKLTYVDDALFGAFSEETAIQVRNEVNKLFQLGGFKLRKWMSNVDTLLNGIPIQDREVNANSKFVSDADIKTLGIAWNPSSDDFSFKVEFPEVRIFTKRAILSEISRLYDPLGWLAPVVIIAKIFIQQLWLVKLDWDVELPPELVARWVKFRNSLIDLCIIHIPRWQGTTNLHLGLELHGFSDASLSAYGAVIYIRNSTDMNDVQTSLIISKTRVSPVKTVSLPRLELCGAALLCQLMEEVQIEMNWENLPVHLWCDSTVVLDWIREHPSKWKVYVANRVALIQDKQPNALWHYVPSADNPADCTTRGLAPVELEHCTKWWQGPSWLRTHSTNWPSNHYSSSKSIVEQEVQVVRTFTCTPRDPDIPLLFRYSNFEKLLRILALCYRFITNSKSKAKVSRVTGDLTLQELDNALSCLIRMIQKSHFNSEYCSLFQHQQIPKSSKLNNLSPFLDSHQILRVGGRLKNSLLNYDEKHPIILPTNSFFTTLLIRHAHISLLHVGTQATLHHLRSKYWIVRGRKRVQYIIKNCVTCWRYKAQSKSQIMGNLPQDRVTPVRAFQHSGIDYAGPFMLKPIKGRTRTLVKSYVAVFVCLVTRAIHLEVVMDLTSEAFVAAFLRFTSRRGRCAKLYSDNAKNFLGANKQLASFISKLHSDLDLKTALLKHGTEWHFIPPASPHFGGIWEAGVKSFKHHFRRVVQYRTLSIEEMLTLVAQIEAALNSRPLYAMSDDPEDLLPLTPGHFLVGESLRTFPTPNTLYMSKNMLSRWQQVQNMYQQLWSRWYKEYISKLQLRNKWQNVDESIKLNDLVLIKEDNLPPSRWLLGRVVQLHIGNDGLVRVVTIKTKDGQLKRAITKLCVLPIPSPNNNS